MQARQERDCSSVGRRDDRPATLLPLLRLQGVVSELVVDAKVVWPSAVKNSAEAAAKPLGNLFEVATEGLCAFFGPFNLTEPVEERLALGGGRAAPSTSRQWSDLLIELGLKHGDGGSNAAVHDCKYIQGVRMSKKFLESSLLRPLRLKIAV